MQTSPIIIYAYASLTLVALYGNYMLIILGVSSLMGARVQQHECRGGKSGGRGE